MTGSISRKKRLTNHTCDGISSQWESKTSINALVHAGVRRLRMTENLELAFREPDAPVELYLNLLKKCLTRSFPYSYEPLGLAASDASALQRFAYSILKKFLSRGWDLARPVDLALRAEGKDWPTAGETMIGLRRLDNLHYCITDIINSKVEGDLIAAGVWRGGDAIFMRAALKAFGDTKRKVWVADSFQGLPKPDPNKYPADKGMDLWRFRQLAVPLDSVKKNFEQYGMLDDRVVFLPGWFRDTLPTAHIERLALARLDGDLYESTMDGLKSLYPKLSAGGYVIIDDYNSIPAAKQATDDFRKEYGITEELIRVDWTAVYWKRGSK